MLIGILVAANILVFGAYFGIRYFSSQLAERVGTNEEVVAELSERPAAGGALNFLVIGSDSRESLPDEFGDFGEFAGQRADVIMVVQLIDGRVQILSLPRDLKVSLPDHGTQKINAAYAFGGAPLMVKTVREVTGVEIHHFAEIDFFGFAQLVDELGGVTITFPNPARDVKSGLDVPAGEVLLDGQMALAYARSRQYQELRGGSWVAVDGSDLGRIQRQQRLIFAMLSAAKRPSIVFDAAGIIGALGEHLSTDATLSGGELVSLAIDARSLSPGLIEAVTLPTEFANEGGVSYLVPDEPAATEVLQAFVEPAAVSGDGGAEVSRASVNVSVQNGNGGSGQATLWSQELESTGYQIDSVADAASFDHAITTVQVTAANVAVGDLIITDLGFGRVDVVADTGLVDAVVIVGGDALGG
jgi:LCP family protein required for cell wall assembly